MDIQAKKLQFIEEYLRLSDESIIDKLERLLKSEMKKAYKSSLHPMTPEELQARIDEAEDDFSKGRVHTHAQVKAYFKNRYRK